MAELRERLQEIAAIDVDVIVIKDNEYGSSWKRRGGSGAFHQALGRKWDRIEEMVRRHGYDLFAAIREDEGKGEPLMETLRDLRRYLLLIEAEVMSWSDKPKEIRHSISTDGQEHPFDYEAAEE